MAMLQEIRELRAGINQKLCSDRNIVDLITKSTGSEIPNRSLLYKNIFPYAYTPEKIDKTQSFICHRIYVPEVWNKTFKSVRVVFYVFVHQDNIRTSEGMRYDLIAERIEELFNGILDFGVRRMELREVNDISPTDKFHGVALEYSVTEFNRPTINGNARTGVKS